MQYMGSKSRLARHLLPTILADRQPGQWYIEPFIGGGNMIQHVPGPRLGMDVNRHVVACLAALRDGWEPPRDVSRAEYEKMREACRGETGEYDDALLGYVGVCMSFHGQWWKCFASDPKRGGRTHRACLRQGLRLRGAHLVAASYEQMETVALEVQAQEAGAPSPWPGMRLEPAIIYCDPPYQGTERYRGIPDFDHEAFWDWARAHVARGHHVFVSEYAAPSDFQAVLEKSIASNINSLGAAARVGKDRPRALERLFVHNSQAPKVKIQLSLFQEED